jgi:hypothetical protein
LRQPADDLGTGRLREASQLIEIIINRGAIGEFYPNKHRRFTLNATIAI